MNRTVFIHLKKFMIESFALVFPKTLKYWVGVQWGHPYLMGRRCLFSLGWSPF